MEKLIYRYIEIQQPVGTIYMGKLPASDIYSISYSRVRNEDDAYGIQRNKNEDRIKAISKYCMDPDAIFPTPVILSGDSKYVTFDVENEMVEIDTELLRKENYKFSIVDGQHRLEGIHRSGEENRFVLPIMLILDTTPEQDAYLFSIINGNQKPVSKSLVLDLFSLSKERTVEKVCNYLVKQLNSDSGSALYRKIKMLGVKDINSPDATVSQATISRNLVKYFSNDTTADNLNLKFGNELKEKDSSQFIFRPYFINEEEQIIYKVLYNYFNAMHEAEKASLESKERSFMQKTMGYTTKIQLLRPLYLKGLEQKMLTKDYFKNELQEIFTEYKEKSEKKIIENYGSSDSGARNLYLDFVRFWIEIDRQNEQYITNSDKKALENT